MGTQVMSVARVGPHHLCTKRTSANLLRTHRPAQSGTDQPGKPGRALSPSPGAGAASGEGRGVTGGAASGSCKDLGSPAGWLARSAGGEGCGTGPGPLLPGRLAAVGGPPSVEGCRRPRCPGLAPAPKAAAQTTPAEFRNTPPTLHAGVPCRPWVASALSWSQPHVAQIKMWARGGGLRACAWHCDPRGHVVRASRCPEPWLRQRPSASAAPTRHPGSAVQARPPRALPSRGRASNLCPTRVTMR
jgi:hypothetical protein